MDLKQLKAFLHVAELGSLSRAAERLHVTQPALSRQIRLLEEDLGTRLLTRTGRGALPTEAGQLLESRARPLVAELQAMAGEVAQLETRVAGEVDLAIPPTLADTTMAELLRDFHVSYPEVKVRVVVALSGAIHEALLRGRVDLGVLYHPLRSANLGAEDLWAEDLDLVAPAQLNFHPDRPVTLAEIAAHPLVLPGARHGLRVIIEAAAVRRGLTLQVAMEVESLRMQLEMVRLGLGCSFLPRRAFADDLAAGRVSGAPVIDPPLRRTAVLAWPADRRRSHAAQALTDMIRDGRDRWMEPERKA
ncbi:LysR family transcriptional regulator [Magnetospira sp. QH-2]|uniref:LysR family transcriptional regulator n=1 Tax=Magnetospira sp. (strain QH-2) TaxID=1288970 RepID=UPI0003E8135C|nr:LysR family transcriptional regulator [Magnetospira sp. QH-2]CCQ75684.1 putative Transcriptional Regulator, LysR family protein [Magnetospira sp. QH-2]